VGNPIIRRCVGKIVRGKEKWEKETCGNMRGLKGEELEDLEHVLVIWMGQVTAKDGTGTDEAARKHVTTDGYITICIFLQNLDYRIYEYL
jgi:hypothetical protein